MKNSNCSKNTEQKKKHNSDIFVYTCLTIASLLLTVLCIFICILNYNTDIVRAAFGGVFAVMSFLCVIRCIMQIVHLIKYGEEDWNDYNDYT